MRIVLISGKAEAGKSHTARELKKNLETRNPGIRVAIVPYGAYVKDTARMIFDWDGNKDEKGRELLQFWGTECVRAVNPNFWVDTVIRLATVSENYLDYILIDDARFPNEIECWRGLKWPFLTIRVERPGWQNALTEEQRKHPSETALDDYEFDIRITAETKEELDETIAMYTPLVELFNDVRTEKETRV